MRSRILLLFLFAAACGGSPDEPSSVATIPLPADTIRAEVLYTTGDHPFGNAASAEPLSDGGVAVVDYLNHHIAIFDEQGELEETLGREGLGPGELQGPSVVTEFPDGTLAVASHSLSRVTLFREDREPRTYPFGLRGTPSAFNGRIAPGPVVYGEHFERRLPQLQAQLVRAEPTRNQGLFKTYVNLTHHLEEASQAQHQNTYGLMKRYSINRHGDFVLLDADSTILVGNLNNDTERRFALPEWDEIEQSQEGVNRLREKLGQDEFPTIEKWPPIVITDLYIDDQGRVWLGRTSYVDSYVGDPYLAVVLNPETGETVGVELPPTSYMDRENFAVRGDRAVIIVEGELREQEVRVLDLSGIPWSPRPN